VRASLPSIWKIGVTVFFAVLVLLDWSALGPAAAAPIGCKTPPPDAVRPPTGAASETPIGPSLLDAGLPCAEDAKTTGIFGDDGLRNLQHGFDFYSWLTFIALNSPADGSKIVAAKPNTPAKWEDHDNFIQLLDVMLPGGAKPDWVSRPPPPPACQSQFKPGMMVVKMIEETFNQPFKTGALIDQRGNYALFDILMNKAMFDYIAAHDFYSQKGQAAGKDAGLKIDFPAGTNVRADLGALMLKVSWKILDKDDDASTFHTVDALVSLPKANEQSPEPPCLHVTLGMVGLHIVHKTEGRPQWIWTSFEHVRNVPEQADVDAHRATGKYNFYDPDCDTTKCPVNATPPRPWDPDPKRNLSFHSGFKSQITRVVPLTKETTDLNGKFQGIVGSVWKNYMLINTQWPSDFACTQLHAAGAPAPQTDFEKLPDMTCAPAPTFLANSTLETYSQGTVPLASSSCMACHGNATSYQLPTATDPIPKFFNQSDFTFILEKAR
jgi:hypothetical protein